MEAESYLYTVQNNLLTAWFPRPDKAFISHTSTMSLPRGLVLFQRAPTLKPIGSLLSIIPHTFIARISQGMQRIEPNTRELYAITVNISRVAPIRSIIASHLASGTKATQVAWVSICLGEIISHEDSVVATAYIVVVIVS